MKDSETGDPPRATAGPPSSTPGPWYVGVVTGVSAAGAEGTIRSEASGRTYPFSLALAEFRGGNGAPTRLTAGVRVGFDLAWTAHGVRVSAIRLLD